MARFFSPLFETVLFSTLSYLIEQFAEANVVQKRFCGGHRLLRRDFCGAYGGRRRFPWCHSSYRSDRAVVGGDCPCPPRLPAQQMGGAALLGGVAIFHGKYLVVPPGFAPFPERDVLAHRNCHDHRRRSGILLGLIKGFTMRSGIVWSKAAGVALALLIFQLATVRISFLPAIAHR